MRPPESAPARERGRGWRGASADLANPDRGLPGERGTRLRFIGFLVAGIGVILVCRVLLPGLQTGVLAAVICAMLIAIAAWATARQEVDDMALAADEIYYLGLLYTLIALICALLVMIVGDSTQRTQDLIGNFGLALTSTVAGIIGRLMLLGGGISTSRLRRGESTASYGRDRRLSRAGAAETVSDLTGDLDPNSPRALRDQLRQARDAFSHFTRVTITQAEQTRQHTEQLVREFNDHMRDVNERALNETAAAWMEGGKQINAQIESSISRADVALANAITRADTGWRQIAEAANANADMARRHAEERAAETEALLARIEEAQAVFPDLADTFNATGAHVAALGTVAGDSAGSLTQGMTDLRALGQGAADAAGALRRAGNDVRQSIAVIEGVGRAFESLAAPLPELEGRVRALEQATGMLAERLNTEAHAVVTMHNSLVEKTERHQEVTINALRTAIEALTTATRQYQAAMGRETDARSAAVAALSEASRQQHALANILLGADSTPGARAGPALPRQSSSAGGDGTVARTSQERLAGGEQSRVVSGGNAPSGAEGTTKEVRSVASSAEDNVPPVAEGPRRRRWRRSRDNDTP